MRKRLKRIWLGKSDENELLMAERKLESLCEESVTKEEEVSDLNEGWVTIHGTVGDQAWDGG